MKAEIRDMWADALESDEYTQGRNHLTTVSADGTEAHCCLGVLCVLAVKAGVIPEGVIRQNGISGDRKAYGFENAEGLLPTEVIEWAEADGKYTVSFEYGVYRQNADTLNDIQGLSFKEIAKLIRAQL